MSETPKKKISLQEAIKQQLANKKNKETSSAQGNALNSNTKHNMKSQQTKKTMSARRKMGS